MVHIWYDNVMTFLYVNLKIKYEFKKNRINVKLFVCELCKNKSSKGRYATIDRC